MISDSDTNIIYFSEHLKTDNRFSDTCMQITETLESFGVKAKFLPETKDIWARDYMPIQISNNKFIEYRYDPDYLQGTRKGYRDLKTYPDIVCDSIKLETVKSDIILDGGNIVKSTNCIILTDKIVKENRFYYNKTELTKRLKDTFNVENVVLIPWDTLDKYGHADGMLRFIDNNTVLINEIYKSDKSLLHRLKQNGLDWKWLEFDVEKKDKRKWAYINFLQTNNLILLPKLNIDEDDQAFKQIEKYYPVYAKNNRIAQIDMTDIVKLGGALNCISWTIKN